MKQRSSKVFVDSIEHGIARLLVGTHQFTLPCPLLPAGTREGSWLELQFSSTAEPSTAQATQRARHALGKKDPGGDIEL